MPAAYWKISSHKKSQAGMLFSTNPEYDVHCYTIRKFLGKSHREIVRNKRVRKLISIDGIIKKGKQHKQRYIQRMNNHGGQKKFLGGDNQNTAKRLHCTTKDILVWINPQTDEH